MSNPNNTFQPKKIRELKKSNKIVPIKLKNYQKTTLNQIFLKIANLNQDEVLVIDKSIIPPQKKYTDPETNEITSNKFMRHAPELKLKRYNSQTNLKKLLQQNNSLLRPAQDIKELYNSINNKPHFFYAGYSFKPFYGVADKETRKFTLTEIIKGTIEYIARSQNDKKINTYDSAKKVSKEGAKIQVTINSRSKDKKFQIMLSNIPIYYNEYAWSIIYGFDTDHICELKRFRNLNYEKESSKKLSKQHHFCAHDVAAYLSVIDYYYNEYINQFNEKQKNRVPYDFRPIIIPNQNGINLFNKLQNNVLIMKSKNNNFEELKKIRTKTHRHLYNAEIEVFLNVKITNSKIESIIKKPAGTNIKNYQIN
jgi:hypothetical protein